MKMRTGFCFLGLAMLCLSSSARADALFTFDTGVSVGTNTPFSLTDNGITATFTSPQGGFQVGPNFGPAAPFSGNLLYDTSSDGDNYIPLDIGFSTPVTSISLDFATDDYDGPSTFNLVAYDNGSVVGSTSDSGTYEGSFPQGVLSFGGVAFDSVELSDDDAPAFAIDNVDVSGGSVAASGVPEINAAGLGCMSILLLGSLALLEGRRIAGRRA